MKLEECKLERKRRVYGAKKNRLLRKGRNLLVASEETETLKSKYDL